MTWRECLIFVVCIVAVTVCLLILNAHGVI